MLDERKWKRKGDQLHDEISWDRGMKENRDCTDKSKRFITAIVGYEQEKCVVKEKSRFVFENRVFFRGRVNLSFKQRGERRD